MKKWPLILAAILLVAAGLMYASPRFVEARFNRVAAPPPKPISARAMALHRTLLIADLHADSLLWRRNLAKKSGVGHVDLPRLREGNVSLQAFTVVTQFPVGGNITRNTGKSDLIRYIVMLEGWPIVTWGSFKERALHQAAQFHELEGPGFMAIRSASDLRRFLDRRQRAPVTAGFLGIEGAQALDGDLKNLQTLYDVGFRMMSPSHFVDTEVGGSASGAEKGGLSFLGRQWVAEMERRHMLIDLAHSSPATIRDVTAIATRPLVVSHTGVRGTCDNNRNLSDEQLRAIVRTGGVIGIGYWETATCGRDAQAIARAIRHAVSVVGAEHVALGSDFDGGPTMPFDTTGLPQITEALLEAGFSEHDIRLIMGENTVRLLQQVLPAD